MSDRTFTVAFVVSMSLHLVFIVGQLAGIPWFRLGKPATPIEVIYEVEALQRELATLQDRIERARHETAASSAASAPIGDRTQIRIPDRPVLSMNGGAARFIPERSAIVDLTDLVAAAAGNPVLLSYFGVIREQIQSTANDRAWTAGENAQGMVLVSFVLTAEGRVHSTAVVGEQSVPSDALRDIALRIVRSAAPFPPFPPSMPEPSQHIVVPLEFLLGP